MATFFRRHRVDARLHPPELPFLPLTDASIRHHLAHSGHHLHHRLQRTHFLQALQLIAEILEIELIFPELGLEPTRLFLVNNVLRLFDQRQNVAHAENAAGHAVGMKLLELIDLLADSREDDRLSHNLTHRQRGASAGIAVKLGEDHAGDIQTLVVGPRRAHSVLSGHGVSNEENLLGLEDLLEPLQLVHELVVDMKPPCGVEDQDLVALDRRLAKRTVRNRLRVIHIASVDDRY